MSGAGKTTEITVDTQSLRADCSALTDNAESFSRLLKELEECFSGLRVFWKGEALEHYLESLAKDLESLHAVDVVLKKLAEDYRFASDEYEKNAQTAEEIIKSV